MIQKNFIKEQAAVLLTLFTASCSDSTLPKYQVLNTLRIAAIVVDQPELNYTGAGAPSATVTFTPYISDVNGGGRALTLSLAYCLDPGIAFGATPTCSGSSSRVVVQSGTAISNVAGQFDTPNYTGAITPIAVDLSAMPAQSSALLQAVFLASSTSTRYNGVALLFEFTLETATGDEKLAAIKRVLLSSTEKTLKNQNPSGLEVRVNDTDIGTAWPTSDTELTAYWPTSSIENYTLRSVSGQDFSESETLQATWFLTGGSDDTCNRETDCAPDGVLNLTRSFLGEINKYVSSVNAPTLRGTVALVVAQDERGGTAVKRLCSGAVCP